MDDLGGVGRVARALVATLPADAAIVLLSLAALLTLLRAERRVPLNSAFARKPERSRRLDEERVRDRPSSTLRRV